MKTVATLVAVIALFALSGCASMTDSQRNAGIGCVTGGVAGVVGDRAIASPTSGLLPLVGCAAGGAAGWFLTPDDAKNGKK